MMLNKLLIIIFLIFSLPLIWLTFKPCKPTNKEYSLNNKLILKKASFSLTNTNKYSFVIQAEELHYDVQNNILYCNDLECLCLANTIKIGILKSDHCIIDATNYIITLPSLFTFHDNNNKPIVVGQHAVINENLTKITIYKHSQITMNNIILNAQTIEYSLESQILFGTEISMINTMVDTQQLR